jgi:hypothetical protein
MITNRRRFLASMAGGMLSGFVPLRGFFSGRAPDEPASANISCSRDEVARMLESVAGASVTVAERITWIATATVTFFSLPVFSRRGVGSGYAVVEEAPLATGENAVSIQFGAGSWPETAHGLNRFGLIHEVTMENGSGEPDESAYGAFIITSREKSLDQANRLSGHQAPISPMSRRRVTPPMGDSRREWMLWSFPRTTRGAMRIR